MKSIPRPHKQLRRITQRRQARPTAEAMEARTLLATIIVTGVGDTIASDGVVTLREAITAANTNAASGDAPAGTAGLDTIAFNIPGGGVKSIVTATDLPEITEPVLIDGYTQPGSQPNTQGPGLSGNAQLLIQIAATSNRAGAAGLRLGGGGSTVRGLVIDSGFNNGIDLRNAGGNTVIGNYIFTTPDGLNRGTAQGSSTGVLVQSSNNRVGGPAPADRNVIVAYNGVYVPADAVSEASNNVFQGNFIGTDSRGLAGFTGYAGVRIGSGSNDLVGGAAPGEGNLIAGVAQAVLLELGGPNAGVSVRNSNGGHVIQGNLMGTDLTGNALLPFTDPSNGQIRQGLDGNGIYATGGGHYDPVENPLPITIGGPAAGAGNVIAGGATAGISLSYPEGFDTSTLIQGNFIGTDRTATRNFGNRLGGINLIQRLRDVSVIGNVIAHNSDSFNSAIIVPNGDSGVFVAGNSIFNNGAGNPGIIRLNGPGHAPPSLTLASATGSTTVVQGSVAGVPGSVLRLDFYANAPVVALITVQGQTPVQTISVTIGANGVATFATSFATVPGQPLITATSTTPGNTTSPFSEPATSIAAEGTADLGVTVVADPSTSPAGGNATFTINVTNAGPTAAQTLSLNSAVPAGATFVSFAAPAGWTASTPAVGGTGNVTATATDLAQGGNATFTLVVRLASDAVSGSSVTATASIASAVADPDPSDNSASASVVVGSTPPVEGPADLSVSITPSTTSAAVGAPIVFTIRVVNNGPSAATGVIASGSLPAELVYLSSSHGSYDATNRILTVLVGSLPVGGEATFTLTARATAAGTHLGVARAIGDQADADQADNTANASVAAAPSEIVGGPRVTSVRRNGIHGAATWLAVTFDRDLDPARAQDVNNYQILVGRRRLRIGSAIYDPSARSVRLDVAQRINVYHPFRLVVVGQGLGGLNDAAGNPLDGAGDGTTGTDYSTDVSWFGQGTRLNRVRPTPNRPLHIPQAIVRRTPLANASMIDPGAWLKPR